MRIWSLVWQKNCAKRERRSNMKKKRMQCFLGQWLVCVLLALLSASVIAQDAADRCGLPNIEKVFRPNEQPPATKDQVFKIQEGLKTIFDKTTRDLSDGIIGEVTRESLKTFCREYPVFGTVEEFPDAVRRSVLHYLEIAAELPNWKQTITSPEFDAWVREPRDDGQIDTRQIRRSGAAPVVIRLLDEFASRGAEGGSPADGAYDKSCSRLLEKTVVDRELEEIQGLDRFKQKKSTRIELQRGLEAVFAGSPEYDDYDGKVEQMMFKWLERFCREYPVPGSPENVPRRVVESVLHYAEIAAARPHWRDVVTDPGFNQWVVSKGAPENRPLRLSGSAPIVIELIAEYPREVIPPPRDAWPWAGAANYYQLSALDLQRLNDRAGFLSQVDDLVGKPFDTEAELNEAIGPIADLLMVDSEREKFLKTIRENKRTLTIGWRLTKKSLNRLRYQLTSPTVTQGAANILQALGGLENEDFESKQKLAQDVKARLLVDGGDAGAADVQSGPPPEPARRMTEAKIKAVVKKVVEAAEEVTAYEITAKVVTILKQDPLFVALSDDELEKLTPLRGVTYANPRLYTSAVCNALTTKDDPKVVQAVVDWARKTGEAKAPLEIHATDDCGCAREWDSIRENRFTVYGFYPFWMSAVDGASGQADGESQEKDAGAAVDFSVLSRIGYFALELDEKGNIADRRLWTAKDGAERFIKTARRYRSKVDLVRHWHTWELPSKEDQKNSNLKQAVDSISSMLDPKSTRPSMLPDGVVLYFPDFPNHFGETETDKISHLVTELRKKLNAGGQEKAPSLNILLDIGDLDGSRRIDDAGKFEDNKRTIPEQKLLAGLKGILVTDPAVDLMLVFLDQPVTEMKKRLRLAVENEFDGEERVRALRKILPVIPPNGHRVETSEQGPYRQLQHDLVYFRDNFRGVAFWPVPTARDKDPEELRKRLVSTFAQSKAPGDGAQVLKTLVPDFCVYVCPNRLAYQIAFFVLLGLLVLLALLASWSCRVRNALKKRFRYLLTGVALLIAIFVALITCDPEWSDQELNILGGLVVLLIGSWLFHYIRKVKQGPLP